MPLIIPTRFYQPRGAFDPAGGASYTGPGDVAGYSGAYAYFGLRAYNAAYAAATGPLADLVRDDAATMTLNCLTTGAHDAATLNAWMAGHTAKVNKLYDQSGNNYHVTAPASTNRPVLTMSGVGLGSVPCMQFIASDPGYLTTAGAAVAQSQPFTVAAINRFNTFVSGGSIWGPGDFPLQMFNGSAAVVSLYAGGSVQTVPGVPDGEFASIQAVFNGASSTGASANAGTNPTGTPSAVASIGTNGIAATNKLTIGAMTDSGSVALNGYLFEVLIVSGAVSSGNQALQVANQRAYGGF